MASTDVATVPIMDDETLGSLGSFSDVLGLAQSVGATVVEYSEEFGSGFTLVKDKNQLLGVEFMIVEMKIHEGVHGDFSVLHLVTIDDRKMIIVDGSTGIHAQVSAMLSKGVSQFVHVKDGLNRSDYTYTDENGKEIPASTFYLSQ